MADVESGYFCQCTRHCRPKRNWTVSSELKQARIWDWVMLPLGVYTYVTVVSRLALNFPSDENLGTLAPITLLDMWTLWDYWWSVDVIYLLDTLNNLRITSVDEDFQEPMNLKTVIKCNINEHLIMELLGHIPLLFSLHFRGATFNELNLTYIHILSVPRISRVNRCFRRTMSFCRSPASRLAFHVVVLGLVLHFLTCCFCCAAGIVFEKPIMDGTVTKEGLFQMLETQRGLSVRSHYFPVIRTMLRFAMTMELAQDSALTIREKMALWFLPIAGALVLFDLLGIITDYVSHLSLFEDIDSGQASFGDFARSYKISDSVLRRLGQLFVFQLRIQSLISTSSRFQSKCDTNPSITFQKLLQRLPEPLEDDIWHAILIHEVTENPSIKRYQLKKTLGRWSLRVRHLIPGETLNRTNELPSTLLIVTRGLVEVVCNNVVVGAISEYTGLYASMNDNVAKACSLGCHGNITEVLKTLSDTATVRARTIADVLELQTE